MCCVCVNSHVTAFITTEKRCFEVWRRMFYYEIMLFFQLTTDGLVATN